ncbi:MAG TPA: biosynthetic-type acetolactate synthase large subunit [Candidatus Lachnoclostridium stercorigallinarum]|uniref:Acetolactate synthase n=1 Tax=Candidatus Lachnoclostridium stercorigallinarum TaxID=2838634 RepID=A0A9D2GGN0_9FIRM|nr:biosynthetic-type acetolactate synthase large subunit [Candidatus Lachnoclostridium stercorigallinarum]
MKLTGADIIAEVLMEQGVDTIFGYPGGAVLNIYDSLYKYSDRIRHVMTAHEQGAAHAADGYARVTGKTGVVLSTSGPGATNLVTGIATAYMDSVPMVAITGNVGTSLIGKDSFQEVFITGITMPITKHNYTVRDVNKLADTLRDAFRIAQSGRKGPVLVDVPKDVTAAVAEFERKPAGKFRYVTNIDENEIRRVADALNQAERPVIYFGGGVVASDAGEDLRELVRKADIPAAYTLMAAGVMGYEDPHNLGLLGMHGGLVSNLAVDQADLVLAFGTRFDDRVASDTEKFARNAKVVHIDIDPSEVNKNVRVDYSLVGDAGDVIRAMLPFVEEKRHGEWMSWINEKKKADYQPVDDDTVIRPHQLMRSLCRMAGEDAVYVTDVGQHQMWAAQYIHHVKPRSFLTSGGLGTMGYGYGAAIGATFGCGGKRRVIHITGDGSFHMNLNEACTAVSYQLPIITVIMNNQVLGMVRQWQTAFYDGRYSSTDPHRRTNFAKVAEGFGAKGFRCETLAEFEAAMEQALKEDGPVWIDCAIGKDEKVLPMIPAGASVDEIMLN